MLFKKQGYPEEHEIVVCTVTSVQPHSVFVNVDDYNKTGLVHISEISPGRIRNIRDYVKEGKVIVCKVLRVIPDKNHIELSLRRVTEIQKRTKLDEMKQEQKVEKILEMTAKRFNKDIAVFYYSIAKPVLERYPTLFAYFEAVVKKEENIDELKLEKPIADAIIEMVEQRMTPEEILITGELMLTSYAPDGVEIIKHAIQKAYDKAENISIKYKGAGKYIMAVKSLDYKTAEKKITQATEAAIDDIKKNNGVGDFLRLS